MVIRGRGISGILVLTLLAALSACSGGSGGSSNDPGSNSPETIQGVATPSSVSVVTATHTS